MITDAYLSEYVKHAIAELSVKPIRQIQYDTAKVWYGRAVAAAKLDRPVDAVEYAHEAIEHAALSGDDGFLSNIREGLRRHGVGL